MKNRLRGCNVLSTIDIKDAFYNIKIADKDTHKTAFRTRYGHFEFVVCPFGFCNSPATFLQFMNRIFFDVVDRTAIIYVDDILIYSKERQEHITQISTVLNRCLENGLKLKLSKCNFLKTEVTWCGMKVSIHGTSILQDSIDSICEMPIPTDIKEVQRFLGMIRFFQDFIPSMAEICTPLFALTKPKSAWAVDVNIVSLIRIIQFYITADLKLRYFDPDLPIHVTTDASEFAIGGWLGQDVNGKILPVAYWSRSMKPAERNYGVPQQELLALVKCIEHFRVFLHGREFVCHTDHKGLEYLQSVDPKSMKCRVIRWLQILQEFMPTIQYQTGETNIFADWLSRREDFLTIKCPSCNYSIENTKIPAVQSISTISDEKYLESLRKYQQTDILCIYLENKLLQIDQSKNKHFNKISKLCNKKDLIWVYIDTPIIPSELQLQFLELYHSNTRSGHHGRIKTFARLYKFGFWIKMRVDIENFIKSCDLCQRSKALTSSFGLLKPIPFPNYRFESVGMDFKELPQTSCGNNMLLVIVCRSTKFVVAIPCKKTASSEDIAILIYRVWYLRGFGLPKSIVSDRDSRFTSSVFKELCLILNIEQLMTTARNQKCDGQSEITIRMIDEALKRIDQYGHFSWIDVIDEVVYSINSSVNTSTGYIPFELVYGELPVELNESRWKSEKNNKDLAFTNVIDKKLQLATTNVHFAQQQMKKFYDLNHKAGYIYQTGDFVLLLRDGIKFQSDIQHSAKLLTTWIGPFKVTNFDLARENIQLELPPSMQCHNVFYTSKIKPYIDPLTYFPNRSDVRPITDPTIDNDGGYNYEVLELLDVRIYRKQLQILVRWNDRHLEDSWEQISNLNNCKELLQAFKRKFKFFFNQPEVKFLLPRPKKIHLIQDCQDPMDFGGSVMNMDKL